MASFTVTMANSLNLFGVAPSNKWNAFNWNAFLWGEGTADLGVNFTKGISNSLSPDTTVGKTAQIGIANSLAPTADLYSEELQDGSGYSYVFPNNTTDGEARDFVTWSSGTAGSATWTSATVTSTSWSES